MALRRTGAAILGVVVVVGLILAAPALVDWNDYRAAVAARLEARLGRKVEIDGPLSVSLLPAPAISARNVQLLDGDRTVRARFPSLEARLDLASLLSGRFDLSTLRLIAPEIRLDQADDGRVSWGAVSTSAAATALAQDKAAGSGARPAAETPGAANSRIDQVVVEQGTVTLWRHGAPVLRLDSVNATAAVLGPNGLIRAAGTGHAAESGFAFDAQVSPWSGDQPGPVSLTVDFDQGAGNIRLAGQLSGSGESRSFVGKVSAKGYDLSRLVAVSFGNGLAAGVPQGAFAIEAALRMSTREIEAEKIALSFAGIDAEGAGSVSLEGAPRLDLSLAAGRLNLDVLLDRLGHKASGAPPPPPALSPPSPNAVRSSGKEAAPGGLRSSWSANLDISTEIVTWRGAVLRSAKLNASLNNGEVTLNQASVTLPGNSEANLFGTVTNPAGVPLFEGSFEASTNDLRGLLDWFGWDTAKVPAERLHAARLAGQISANPDQLSLAGTRLQLDSSRIDLAATLRFGVRPALGASFVVDTLNGDAYQPTPASPSAAFAVNQAVAAAAAPPPSARRTLVPAWLAGLDANVKGRIGQLVAHGLTLQDVAADAAWVDGLLTLHELSATDPAGDRLQVQGAVAGLAGQSPLAQGLRYDLRGKDLGRLLRQLRLEPPGFLDRMGAFAVNGQLDGGADLITWESHAEAAGGKWGLSGKVESLSGAPKADLAVELAYPATTQLLGLMAPESRHHADLGPLALSGRLTGDDHDLQLADLRGKLGTLTVGGQARLALAGRPRLEAALTLGDVSVGGLTATQPGTPVLAAKQPVREPAAARPALPEPWSRDPVDLAWLSRFDAAVTVDAHSLTVAGIRLETPGLSATLTDGVVAVDRLSALLYGGRLTGGGTLDGHTNNGRMKLALAHAQIKDALLGIAGLDFAEGILDADISLSTSGHSEIEMITRLTGGGTVAVQSGVLRGFDLKAVDDRLRSAEGAGGLLSLLQAGVSGGKTNFASLAGSYRIENGMVEMNDLKLTAMGGGAVGDVRINLPASSVDAQIGFHLDAAPAAPPLVIRLVGPLAAPRRFLDINAMEGWLAQQGKGTKPKDLLKGLLQGLDKLSH